MCSRWPTASTSARLGKRAAVLNPKKISMSDTVAVMTGAMPANAIPPNALRIEDAWCRR
jgi:hypothetical protein